MASSGVSRRQSFKQTSAEAQALQKISEEAETRSAANKLARREAREYRARELERQQIEEEHKKLGHIPRSLPREDPDVNNKATVSSSAGGASPTGNNLTTDASLLLKNEFSKLKEKLRKAEDVSKHLDGEMLVYRCEVELRKDEMDDLQEHFMNVEHKKKEHASELIKVKESLEVETEKCEAVKQRLQLMYNLIRENGLLKSDKSSSPEPASTDDRGRSTSPQRTSTSLSVDRAQILQGYSGTVEDRLKQIFIEKEAAEKQVLRLKAELLEARERSSINGTLHSPTPTTTGSNNSTDLEISAEAVKQLNEYRLKLKKSEQEITTLEGNSGRLETQMKRYKLASETLEKSEEELKVERRKLQRELREARIQIEELTEQNGGLKNRLEKLKKDKVTATK